MLRAVIQRQVVAQDVVQQAEFVPGGFVFQGLLLTDGGAQVIELALGHAFAVIVFELGQHLVDRVCCRVLFNFRAQHVLAFLRFADQVGAGAVGVAFVFTQVEVDAAVEVATQWEVAQISEVVVAEGVVGQAVLGDTHTGLCGAFFIYQVDGAAVDFRFLQGDGRACGLCSFQLGQPIQGFDDLFVGQAGANGDPTQVRGEVGFVVLLNVVQCNLFNGARQARTGIAERVFGAAHYRAHGAGCQALWCLAGLL